MVLLTHLKDEVIKVVRRLILSDELLEEYMETFDQEINRGLDKETSEESTVKSIVTHVNKLPTGTEEGVFIGLNFTSTTIKLVLVKLEFENWTVTRKLYDIPVKYRTGKAELLFDFIAQCIVDFLREVRVKMSRIPLGVTFGFPMEQTSLQDSKLVRWSKDFKCDDLIGKNIFTLLKDSIRRYPELRKIYVVGIISDSVSAALSCEWKDPNCMIGAVIGEGVSCCYVEKVHKITKYDAENYGIRDMYINLESGRLGETGNLEKFQTEFDLALDESSSKPGKFINEKMISMDYFGDLVRLILLRCLDSGIILGGEVPPALSQKHCIKTHHLKRIESDPDDDHTNCREVLTELGFKKVTDNDCFQVQFICRCVSRRSANLVAALLTTLIHRINVPFVTIAVDGVLVKEYPNYKWYLNRKIKQLKKEECEFLLRDAEESGLGEAVLAAVFGEDVMNKDEKLRRLPGFPMNKCHFGKKGKCLNPECVEEARGGCLDNPLMIPLPVDDDDLIPDKCKLGHDAEQDKEGKCKECKGYDRMI